MPTLPTPVESESVARLVAVGDALSAQAASLTTSIDDLVASRAGGETHFDPASNEGDPISVEIDQLRQLRGSVLDELAQINAALERARSGSYGLCETCADPIPPARLEAIPGATQCVACKSARR